MRKRSSRSAPARVKAVRAKSDRQFRSDGFVNVLTKYGTKHDSSEAYRFEREAFVSDIFLTTLYEGNGLFVKVIDTPAEEALKHGFELNLNNKDIDNYIEELLDELEWEEKAATAIKWARLYGGSIIVMIINDGRGIDEPVDWDNIKSIDELLVFERAVVTPDYSSVYVDELNGSKSTRVQRFGEPQYYLVSSTDCYFTVHESRCLIFRNGKLPDQTSNSDYRYWGMPEYVRIKRALRETITAHENSTKFLERSVQPIYSMKNLASILGTDDGEEKIMKRLDIIDMARSLLNSIAIDADGESYEFKTFQFTGVKDVIDATCNMLSALTNIPQTILFGRSPAGMNATGESDFENYYNFVERIQKQMLKKNLRYLLDIAFKAGLSSGGISEEPDYKLKFKPLWSLSDTEQATVDQTKAATALTKAQTAQIYIDMQAMDPSEVRAKLASDDDFVVEEIVNDEADNDLFNALYAEESSDPQEPMTQEIEPNLTAEQKISEYGLTNSENSDKINKDERCDAGSDDDIDWITASGSHIPVKNGVAVGGAGGKAKGKDFSVAKSQKNSPKSNSPEKPAENISSKKSGSPAPNAKFYGIEQQEEASKALTEAEVGTVVKTRSGFFTKTGDNEWVNNNWTNNANAKVPITSDAIVGTLWSGNLEISPSYIPKTKVEGVEIKPTDSNRAKDVLAMQKAPNGTTITTITDYEETVYTKVGDDKWQSSKNPGNDLSTSGVILEASTVADDTSNNGKVGYQTPDNSPLDYSLPKGQLSDLEAEALLSSTAEDWGKSLKKNQKSALSSYTFRGDKAINSALRAGGDSGSDKVKKQIKAIDDAIASFDLQQDIKVYRGTSTASLGLSGNIDDSIIGKVISDPAYSSTTVERGRTDYFSNKAVTHDRAKKMKDSKEVTLELDIPAGKGRGAYVSQPDTCHSVEEREFLVKRGAEFEIYGYEPNENGYTIKGRWK